MAEIFSFDIFDTVITRPVYPPDNMFFIVREMLRRSGLSLPGRLVDDFHSERVRAELAERFCSGKEEVSIAGIYDRIAAKYGLSGDVKARILEIETGSEIENVIPVEWTVRKIRESREKGGKIIFVSDMYLPVVAIKKMLDKSNAYEEGDPVYVSGETGLTKRTGSLFRYILEKESCRAGDMTHLGDDPYDDVYMPYSLGIDVYGMPEKMPTRIRAACLAKRLKYILFGAAGAACRGFHAKPGCD